MSGLSQPAALPLIILREIFDSYLSYFNPECRSLSINRRWKIRKTTKRGAATKNLVARHLQERLAHQKRSQRQTQNRESRRRSGVEQNIIRVESEHPNRGCADPLFSILSNRNDIGLFSLV
jgi:hypothetical protein